MKKLIYISIVLCLASCTNNFEAINTNPNDPTEVDPEFILRHVIYNLGEEMSYEGFVAGNLLAQHFTMVDFNLFDRHALSDPQLGGNPWPVLYRNLRDVHTIIKLSNEDAAFADYAGPAKILKAYIGMALTDIYGDVPFFQAGLGSEGEVTPNYDLQKDIYQNEGGIESLLLEGIENCKNGGSISGDILYGGDLNKWLKFGNSLLFKMHMRISNVALETSSMKNIHNEESYITTNADNASFDFTDLPPNSFRMQQLRDGDFNLFVMSETMEEIMSEFEDPRIEKLFRPIESDTSGQVFKGLRNGPNPSIFSISVGDYSLPGTIFRDHTGDLDASFITAWEMNFLIAEAAEKEFITNDPEPFYRRGVELAFEYWGVEMPDDYLIKNAYDGSSSEKLELIATQKWIANSINGYENWIEQRRTGFPEMKSVSSSLNNGSYPSRMPYPAEEEALNSTNYSLETFFNDNSINIKVWWDNN